jgi:hypothetical protein
MKRRRMIMMIVNALAALAAVGGAAGYFRFGQTWALVVFLAAVIAGFVAQIWFIAGLRGPGKGA